MKVLCVAHTVATSQALLGKHGDYKISSNPGVTMPFPHGYGSFNFSIDSIIEEVGKVGWIWLRQAGQKSEVEIACTVGEGEN
jgi:hypothetical protein